MMGLVIGPDRDLLVATTDDHYVHLSGLVVGIRDKTFHAFDAEQIHVRNRTKSRRRTYDAACGAKVRAWVYVDSPEVRSTALWPIRVSRLKNGATRCRECHEATGRRRPSGYFPAGGAA